MHVNLTLPGYYQYWGRCRPLKIVREPGVMLTISCLVYEQIVAEHAVPCFREVAACGWAPCAALLGDHHVRRLQWSSLSGQSNDTGWDGYPSVLLPMEDVVLAKQRNLLLQSVKKKFVLWGLTLRIINDMLLQCKLRDTPVDFTLIDRLHSKPYPDQTYTQSKL